MLFFSIFTRLSQNVTFEVSFLVFLRDFFLASTETSREVWPAGARKLLSKLPVNEPVDNWMAVPWLGGGNSKIFCFFDPILGEDEPIWTTVIFFKWVGSTTN